MTWQDSNLPIVEYDTCLKSLRAEDIQNAADSIKIFHEGKNPEALKAAREHINEAKKVLFLGFGFHPVNITRLLPGSLIGRPSMFGTAMGIDIHAKDEMLKLGFSQFNKDYVERNFPNTTILDFLQNHSVSRLE